MNMFLITANYLGALSLLIFMIHMFDNIKHIKKIVYTFFVLETMFYVMCYSRFIGVPFNFGNFLVMQMSNA